MFSCNTISSSYFTFVKAIRYLAVNTIYTQILFNSEACLS